MIWRKRHPRGKPRPTEETTRMPTTLGVPVREVTTEDLAAAQKAAHDAAVELHQARERRPKIDDLVDKIDMINRENGFAELIRRAFGS